jgi:ABC-type bacteriocin/lantibiotic exporter with double-glycine peptidase domain
MAISIVRACRVSIGLCPRFCVMFLVIVTFGLLFPCIICTASDLYCGPRVTQRILQHYGQDVELVELVKRMQPQRDQGCSLLDVEIELKRCGVDVVPLLIANWDAFQWPYPVIVHQSPPTRAENLGHLAVLSSSGGHMNLWDGLNPSRAIESNEIEKFASGYVLITSNKAIETKDLERVFLSKPSLNVPAVWWSMAFFLLASTAVALAPIKTFKRLQTYARKNGFPRTKS